ncbi:hypothetical protein PR048_013019 [Dryococelus australis]|uniref:Tesmin/TSO1-like CXC domain-containing protein n=1 Tax=Dryococelus australis TaxID=614101 RepID=A0ABQ9HRF5_9NEOP|nr:hypothetical protein PR048_013019 [Dryococelus australis]
MSSHSVGKLRPKLHAQWTLSGRAVPQRRRSYGCTGSYKPSPRGAQLWHRSGAARTLCTCVHRALIFANSMLHKASPTKLSAPYSLARSKVTKTGILRISRFLLVDDICFTCDNSLSDGNIAVVERGLQTLKDASFNRGDGYIEHLKNLNTVTTHFQCRKDYIRKSSIIAFKRRRDEEDPGTSQSSPREMRRTKYEGVNITTNQPRGDADVLIIETALETSITNIGTRLAEVFKQENCSPNLIVDTGIHFLLAVYGAPISEVKFLSLPPTAAAAQQHLYRVYYQPIITLLPPASGVLLSTIFCSCTRSCGTNCGCRKVGLPCSIVCGHCRGQSCLNPNTDPVSSDASADINTNKTEYDEINNIDYLTSKLSKEQCVNEEDQEKEISEVEYDEVKEVPEVEDDEKES